jgi:hypothetical protein
VNYASRFAYQAEEVEEKCLKSHQSDFLKFSHFAFSATEFFAKFPLHIRFVGQIERLLRRESRELRAKAK